MIDPQRSAPILATLLIVLAACGGSGSTTTASADSGSGAGQSQAVVAEPTTGGEGATDVCGLVTADELAGILGVAVTTEVFAGPPDTCQVGTTDGADLAAFVLTREMGGVSASFVFDSYAGSPTATQVSGIGEKAAYDPSQGALVVLKNGAVLSVAVFDDGSGSTDEAARFDQMKQIAAAAVGRM